MPSSLPCAIPAPSGNKAKIILANIWICSVFIVWTLLFLPIGICLAGMGLLLHWEAGTNLMRRSSYAYARALWWLLSPTLPVRVHRPDEAKQHAPCIIVANHQSFLDLFLFGMQNCNNFCYLSKSWPYTKLFFFAPMMRYAEYIDVETTPLDEVERRCLTLLAKGVSLVIFPEGQRTRTGELGNFHAGAFRLACLANVPVVPMVIENSGAVFPVGGAYFMPQPLRLTLLPALYPQDFATAALPHRAMMRTTREHFVRHCNTISQEVNHG